MRTSRRVPLALLCASLVAALGGVIWSSSLPVGAATTPVTLISDTFEDGTTESWAGRSSTEVVANSTTVAYAGTHSLGVTGRTSSWQGPTLNVLDTLELGVQYTITVWTQLASGEAASSARLSVERQLAGTASYDQVVGNTAVSAGTWTKLSGTYTLATDVDFLTVYVETSAGTSPFFIDDFTISYVPATPIQTGIPALKDAFSFPIGAAVSRATLLGEHGQLLAKHFNSLTAGNSMKWDATERTENTFSYTDGDAMVTFAKANNIKVRGHTLVWHNQTPSWVFLDAAGATMTATAENKTLLLSRLENHIRNVAGHYANDIYAWDVVNEVIDENQSDGLRRSTWYNITGLDYIRTAFRVAREVAPNAKLYINDYNTTVAAKRDKLYNLVSQLKAEGIPVDGVGHQMHCNVDWPSAADTDAALTKFAALGVEQQVTEMDVSVYTDSSSTYPTISPDLLTKQAARYKALFDVFVAHKSQLTSVTLWGLADDDTWLKTYPITRLDLPLLFDEQLQAKPAYWSLIGQTSPTGATASPSSASPSSSSASPSRSVSSSSASPSSSSASPSRSVSSSPSSSSSPGPLACMVTYAVSGQWQGGFQGTVTIKNLGTTAINGWTLTWSFANGQQITQLWNGTVTQSGATVTVANAAWNGTIASNATANVGFLANWTGSNTVPTTFAVNGHTC